jgi:hypothetical protein
MIEDLHEVVELYRSCLITPDVERFTMDDALEAYRRLRDGELDARAVVVPIRRRTDTARRGTVSLTPELTAPTYHL